MIKFFHCEVSSFMSHFVQRIVGYDDFSGRSSGNTIDNLFVATGLNVLISLLVSSAVWLRQVGGVALYVLMTTGKRDSKAVRFLAGTACTFGFNGVYMMLSCMMSATSAYYLPRLFYYIVFQGTGAACYLVSSLYIVRDSHQVAVQPVRRTICHD
ncbi:hypothetical protein V5799_007097 [Amblyomma americanum]|uniref:Uncharacterized protein n=1 Tax=Amblyomma americanum TaxID=6943 RepID=A0AAQ4DUI4_AMBAM